jgi:hypothetical protein
MTPHAFKYGVGKDVADLTCVLPVRVCKDCGAEFVDSEGEQVRNDTVCRHLGRLTPAEVLATRSSVGSRARFEELTGIGEASTSRWETGSSIQTKAFDNYIFLLGFKDNLDRLKERTIALAIGDGLPLEGRFRSIEITEQRLAQERRFTLRPAA